MDDVRHQPDELTDARPSESCSWGLASDRARYHAWKQYFAWREDLRRRWAASEVAQDSPEPAALQRLFEALSAGRPAWLARQELRHLRHRLARAGDLEAIEDERDAQAKAERDAASWGFDLRNPRDRFEWELTSIAYARHAARAFPVVARQGAALCPLHEPPARRTPRARPLAGPTRRT